MKHLALPLCEAHELGAGMLALRRARQPGGASGLQAQIAVGHRPRDRQAQAVGIAQRHERLPALGAASSGNTRPKLKRKCSSMALCSIDRS